MEKSLQIWDVLWHQQSAWWFSGTGIPLWFHFDSSHWNYVLILHWCMCSAWALRDDLNALTRHLFVWKLNGYFILDTSRPCSFGTHTLQGWYLEPWEKPTVRWSFQMFPFQTLMFVEDTKFSGLEESLKSWMGAVAALKTPFPDGENLI